MRINSNIPSLIAQKNLGSITRALSKSLERLSSGRRINHASDDVSGLAVSESLGSFARALGRVQQNINESFGYLYTADGVLQTQTELVQRMRELALQSSSGTVSVNERGYLNDELQSLLAEFERVSQTASFNGTKLLNGELGEIKLQVGAFKDQSVSFEIDDLRSAEAFTSETVIGTGALNAPTTFALSLASNADALTVHDLNADGFDDLLIANGDAGAGYTMQSIYLSDGQGSLSLAQTLTLGSNNNPIFGDFNGDGSVDFINGTSVFIGNGDGTFARGTTLTGSSGLFAASGDLNSDGRDDLVSTVGTNVIVLTSNGDGSFQSSQTLAVLGNTSANPVLGDLNGDGKLDIAAGSGTNVSILFNSGSGSFTQSLTIATGAAGSTPSLVDLSGDGILDLAYRTNSNSFVRINNGSGSFGAAQALGSNYLRLEFFDNDADGDLDVQGVGITSFRSFLNDGTGTAFSGTATVSVPAGLTSLKFGDFNLDNRVDYIDIDGESIGVHLGNGDGTYRLLLSPSIKLGDGVDPAVFGANALIDLNADGVLDVIGSNTDGAVFPNSVNFLSLIMRTEVRSESINPDIRTQESAQDMLQVFDDALEKILSARASIAATQNRLDYAQSSSEIARENILLAKSQILDADISQELAEFSKHQILQQASIAVLGASNISLQTVLQLLRPL